MKILHDLNLIDIVNLDEIAYYRRKDQNISPPKYKYSIDSEVAKFKRSTLATHESLLRQGKLLQSIRSSGEAAKLIELIDKWESSIKEIIRELYNHQTGERSIKNFVKKLGLDWNDLGFSEEEDSDSESESESECDVYNFIGNKENCELFEEENNENYKRIKYDD